MKLWIHTFLVSHLNTFSPHFVMISQTLAKINRIKSGIAMRFSALDIKKAKNKLELTLLIFDTKADYTKPHTLNKIF